MFTNPRLDAALDAAWAAFVAKEDSVDDLYECLRAGVEAALEAVDAYDNPEGC